MTRAGVLAAAVVAAVVASAAPAVAMEVWDAGIVSDEMAALCL